MNALVRVRSLFDAVFHVQRLRAQLTPEGQTLLDALLAHRSVLRHRMRPVLDGALAAPARGDICCDVTSRFPRKPKEPRVFCSARSCALQ